MDAADAYETARARVTARLRACTPEELATRVPSCPRWTVREVAAHLAGIPADTLAGRLDGPGTEPWTAAQVATRKDWTLDQILAEWAETGPKFTAALSGHPILGQPVADLHSHSWDIRHALGDTTPPPPADELAVGLDFLASAYGDAVDRQGLPTLRLDDTVRTWTLGSGTPTATVRATTIDLLRSFTGRRTRAQILALRWTGEGDPSIWIDLIDLGPFTVPQQTVEPVVGPIDQPTAP